MSELKVELVGSSSDQKRVAVHSHIRGLGLSENGEVQQSDVSAGLVGQSAAREALGVVADLVRAKRMAGRAVLLAGPPGTGKTALALALSKELGEHVPFCAMVGSDVYSAEVKKTTVLTEYFRRAIGLRMKLTKEIFEGEVEAMRVEETDNPLGGYGKAVSFVLLTLRTAHGSRAIKLDATAYEALEREKVAVGDVVAIEASTGVVRRVGRCDIHAADADLEADSFVPLPKGDVHVHREVMHELTLHDIDVANALPSQGQDAHSLLGSLSKQSKTDITEKLRLEVNTVVNRYIEQGIAELSPGVLFIDEAHMLDLESFTFLNKALESTLAPVLVLATNRGHMRLRGSTSMDGPEALAPHGISRDLLDRLVIISTKLYSKDEVMRIIQLRAEVEQVALDETAISELGEIGARASMRYTIQLLAPAQMLAGGLSTTVTADHICDAASLFHPAI